MKKRWKVFITILVLVLITISFLASISVGLSSHNIPIETRNYYTNQFLVIAITGILLIMIVWINFKKLIKKNKN